mmetsp:Transcript_33945/g.76002  ORF Transcript_33945/g.76002 Transcript_33945/m.76002 type:complete len:688 (-) Transcript_33945:47-2110(-)
MRVALSFGVAVAVAARSETNGAALGKVIQLLNDMADNGKRELQDEQAKFARFSEFCKNTRTSKETSIAKSKDSIEALQAEIQKLTADVEELSREVADLAAHEDQASKEIETATADRKKEHAEYQAQLKEYVDSLDATERVIKVLQEQNHDRAQASLLQLSSEKALPEAARRVIAAFVDQDPSNAADLMQFGSPEANAYEFQGGGIVAMMEKLKDKFREEKGQLEKEEMNAQQSYEMVKFDLENQIKGAQKVRADKEQRIAKKNRRSGAAKGELDDATSDLKEDTAYLNELNAECQQKHDDFASRSKLRQEEIAAIDKAVEILSSPEMKMDGVTARDQKYGLAQKATSFAQLRSTVQNPAQRKAISFLMSKGHKLKSQVLSELALRCEGDVFANVKKLIRDMIHKLLEEANEEAEHKGWCDTELTTNQQTRDRKTSQVEQAQASISELQASNAKLTAEVEELQAEIAQLEAGMAKATEDRAAEKAKNKAAVEDAKAAQVAVANALSVLEEFYSKAKGATALAQGVKEDAPETFSEPYNGQQGESGGVVGMLEVIQSDFARLESDTEASEAESKEEYEKFMGDSQTDKAVKETEIKNKNDKITRQAEDLSQTEESLADTEKELDAAMDYYEKLKPSCVGGGVNYDDRVKQREEEIQSLKEALSILKGDDIPMPIESGRADYETGASHQE